MDIKIDNIIPFIIGGFLLYLFIFNNKVPIATIHGNNIIPPKKEIALIRGTDKNDSQENDNKVEIVHKDSGDKLEFLMYHNFFVLPNDATGLPTKTGTDGKEYPIWTVTHHKRDYIFDPGFDFGTYAGFLTGPTENTTVKPFDVGIKLSPIRIYNTLSPELLMSNQGAGLGITFHPSEDRFGSFWHNMGIGYGRMWTFNDSAQRSIFYLSISTRF